jgi:hypothetical protein
LNSPYALLFGAEFCPSCRLTEPCGNWLAIAENSRSSPFSFSEPLA